MEAIDHLQYLKDLEIKDLTENFPCIERALDSKDLPTSEGIEQSFMNAKSVVSFVSEINGQRRDDVLNSVLLAQLAANKQFPGDDQSLEWYKEFVKVLNNLGWNIQAAEFSHFESKDDVFEVQNVIIDILMTAFGGSFVNVITKTLDAIKGLADSNGKNNRGLKKTHIRCLKVRFKLDSQKKITAWFPCRLARS